MSKRRRKKGAFPMGVLLLAVFVFLFVFSPPFREGVIKFATTLVATFPNEGGRISPATPAPVEGDGSWWKESSAGEGIVPDPVEKLLPPSERSLVALAEATTLTAREIIGGLTLQRVFTPESPLRMPLDAENMVQGRTETTITVGIVYREESSQKGPIKTLLDKLFSKEVNIRADYKISAYVDVTSLAGDRPPEIVGDYHIRVVLPHAVYATPARVAGSLQYAYSNKGWAYWMKSSSPSVREEAGNLLDEAAIVQQENALLPNGRSLPEEAEAYTQEWVEDFVRRQALAGAEVYLRHILSSSPDYTGAGDENKLKEDMRILLDEFQDRLVVEVVFE